MSAPRFLLALSLAWPFAVFAKDNEVEPALPPVAAAQTAAPEVVVSEQAAAALAKIGWKARKDGSLERVQGEAAGLIPAGYLKKAKIGWKDGQLFFDASPENVFEQMLGPILRGLSSFTKAARVDRMLAGRTLAAWGLPPSCEGRRLYNPAGDATYYGIMIYAMLADKPEQTARLSVERMAQALDLLDHAFFQAFDHQAPDVAQTDLDRARLILFAPPRAGETTLWPNGIRPRPDPVVLLKEYKAALQAEVDAGLKAGDAVRQKDSADAIGVLNTLERQRFHISGELPPVPEPGKAKESAPASPDKEPYYPMASGLPRLLKVLDRVYGGLTTDQQENLIRSFPMGELVWRMGAQDLWRQGLTGKGIKVGVIDMGIAEHPETNAAVRDRTVFLSDRGRGAVGKHGIHVAGTIHALAPEAEIRGYAVLQGEEGNATLNQSPEGAIQAAIHKAVKDGNHVINMSLGGSDGPSSETTRIVEEYARRGVIFFIAAGNARNSTGGISSPGSAPSAITVGALDSAGRMADFSSFGARFDARRLASVVKDVFLAPGVNTVSTLPSPALPATYGPMSGTSMATPTLAGVGTLMLQDVLSLSVVPSPIETAERLKSALALGSTPMALDKLPPTVPFDENFFVVNPLKALDALRAANALVADKK